jgi:hypothetical protein
MNEYLPGLNMSYTLLMTQVHEPCDSMVLRRPTVVHSGVKGG